MDQDNGGCESSDSLQKEAQKQNGTGTLRPMSIRVFKKATNLNSFFQTQKQRNLLKYVGRSHPCCFKLNGYYTNLTVLN